MAHSQEPCCTGGRKQVSAGGASPFSRSTSLRLLVHRMDSPSVTVSLRRRAVDSGRFLLHLAGQPTPATSSQPTPRVYRYALWRFDSRYEVPFFDTLPSGKGAPASREFDVGGRRARGVLLAHVSRMHWAGEALTFVSANLPTLLHSVLEGACSANRIYVPDAVAAAISSVDTLDAVRRLSPVFCFVEPVVDHLDANSAPLFSYHGLRACLRATLGNLISGSDRGKLITVTKSLQASVLFLFRPYRGASFFMGPVAGPPARLIISLELGRQISR